jgi:hypothetical protein
MTMTQLTKKIRDALVVLREGPQTVYDVAESLFNERYGITASRAGGRLQALKRLGLAANSDRIWRITDDGRAALADGETVSKEG